MCDINFDNFERCSVWTESLINRARKPHHCDMCGGTVSPGSPYIKHFSVFEGYKTSEKRCLPCDTITCAFRREHRIGFPPSGMREMIVECLQEDQVYDENIDDYVINPLSDSALRWRHALEEMERRAELRKET